MTKLLQVLCNLTSILREHEPSGSMQSSARVRPSVYFCVNREALRTRDCDTAGGEHLYGSLELFDPVGGCRVELRFVAVERREKEKEKRKTKLHSDEVVFVFVLYCIRLHKIKRFNFASKCWPLEVIFYSQMS